MVPRRWLDWSLPAALLAVLVFGASFAVGLFDRRTPPVPAAHAPPSPPPAGTMGTRPRIEVLNASGISGLARRATEELRGGGFDVVYFGNAAAHEDTSLVLDRAGKEGVARAVGDRLGIARVEQRADSTLMLDATVLLGEDWNESPPPPSLGWRERLRRLFRRRGN